MAFLSVWAGFSKGLGSYLGTRSRLCLPRCPASRSSSVRHRWICHKGSTLFWKPLSPSEDTTSMGLVSKAKEQPDLLLPLLAPIPPLPGDVGTSEQRVSYPGEKEGFVLVWIPEQAQPRIREAPLLAQGRWWGLVAGEGLDHPVQQAHLIKSLWLLPETAPTLPGGFFFCLPCKAVPLWLFALPGQTSQQPHTDPTLQTPWGRGCLALHLWHPFSSLQPAFPDVQCHEYPIRDTSHPQHKQEPTAWEALIQAIAAKHHLWTSERETKP